MSEHVSHETSTSAASTTDSSSKRMAAKDYLSFEEARAFAKSLQLKTRKEWRLYVKTGIPGKAPKPSKIPAHPDGIYKLKGWQGWKYWLGTVDGESTVKH